MKHRDRTFEVTMLVLVKSTLHITLRGAKSSLPRNAKKIGKSQQGASGRARNAVLARVDEAAAEWLAEEAARQQLYDNVEKVEIVSTKELTE